MLMPWVIGAIVTLVLLGLVWVGWQILTAPVGWEDEHGWHVGEPTLDTTDSAFIDLMKRTGWYGNQYPEHAKIEWLEDDFMPRLTNEVAVTFIWDWPSPPRTEPHVQGVV